MPTISEYLNKAIVNKPTDGSDMLTLEDARRELGKLRKVARRVCDVLDSVDAPPKHQQTNGVKFKSPSVLKEHSKTHRKALQMDQSFKAYKKVPFAKSDEQRALIKGAVQKNALFANSTDLELEEYIDVFVERNFKQNDTVIQQGDEGDTFYVVQSGSLDIFINVGEGSKKTEQHVGVPYGAGGAFGELALIYGSPRAATIRASADCVLWEISRTAFKGLQLQMEQRAYEVKITQLKKVKVGDKLFGEVLEPNELESMALATHYQQFKKGHAIVTEGEKGDVFYIITRGEVDIFKKSAGDVKIASLSVNSFFGEKALLNSDTRQATVVAATDVECLALERDEFVSMLGDLQSLLEGKRQTIADKAITPTFHLQQPDSAVELTLNQVQIRRVLGEGAFGKVNLGKSVVDGRLFALKAQSKHHIVKLKQEEKVLTEYKIMRQLDHTFIVKCYQAFQDSQYIYFLMSLLPGGELMDLLDTKQKLPEQWTRFYAATVVMAFSCMHQQKIAYRDLKPENLVLDEEGYCFVVDFGLAKVCSKGKTWTMCGTPDYLAPEILRGNGHDWGVDYWALGILLYELTNGDAPFYADDPALTAKKIIKGEYVDPPHFSEELNDIISQFLCGQSKRLGRTMGGERKIMTHPWFAGFNWQALMDREMKVPYKPKVGKLEKLGRKDDGKWDAPVSNWSPVFEELFDV
jgi:cGMP-dependent protein kinase